MSDIQIYHEAPIKAPPSAIYAAITDPRMLARWWIPDTRGESEVGGRLQFWLGEFCQEMEVTALETDRLVRWRTPDPEPADWADTEVEFEILPGDDVTRVRFRHGGFARAWRSSRTIRRAGPCSFPASRSCWRTARAFRSPTAGSTRSRRRAAKKEDLTMHASAAQTAADFADAFAAQIGDRARPFALVVRFRVRPGTEARITDAFARASVETAKEDGAVAYRPHREAGDTSAFLVYEQWRSVDDLESHLSTPYIADLRAEIDAAMEGDPEFRIVLPV